MSNEKRIKFYVVDTFNKCVLSTHFSIETAVKAEAKFHRSFRKNHTSNSYIPTRIRASDNSDISNEVEGMKIQLIH